MVLDPMLSKMRDSTLPNPFVCDTPVTGRDMFVGRRRVFDWILEELASSEPFPPFVLEGQPGIGKTSVLGQIITGRLGRGPIPIYLDVCRLPLGGLTEFLWALAKATMGALDKQNIPGPRLEKRLLVLRPWQAFNQHFWRYLAEAAADRPLLFMLDNFDELVGDESDSQTRSIYRQRLYELFESSGRIAVLLTLTSRLQAFDPHVLAPFHIARSHHLSAFTPAETLELLRRAASFPAFSDLSTLIHDLTGGHPGDVQRIGYTLHERGRSHKLRQITLTDVMAVLDMDLRPKDFQSAVYARRAKMTLRIPRERVSLLESTEKSRR